jgi:hypothetical protein
VEEAMPAEADDWGPESFDKYTAAEGIIPKRGTVITRKGYTKKA